MVRVEKLERLAADYMALDSAERLAFINMLAGIARAEVQVERIASELDGVIDQVRQDRRFMVDRRA